MRRFIYDIEVFKYDWLVIFKEMSTGKYTIIHNNADLLIESIDEEAIYIGFNSKHYDRHIIKGILVGFDNYELKELNDYLISGGQGWEYPWFEGRWPKVKFNNVDIMDDMQLGLSLKAIEGHLGMNIQETEVDFDLDRPLTKEELDSTIFYCKHDVDATEEIVKLRKDYLENKVKIGEMAGLDKAKALSLTNAKLTSALLKAQRVEHDDERQYVYPANLKREYIPQEVFDFFDRMYDPNISDEEFFNSKLELSIGKCQVTIGLGGIHGCQDNFMWKEGDKR